MSKDIAASIIAELRENERTGKFNPDGYFRTPSFSAPDLKPVNEPGLQGTATWVTPTYQPPAEEAPYPGDGCARAWTARRLIGEA